MKVIRRLESIRQSYPYPVLSIGAFDGIHLGHQEMIRTLRERAREREGTSMLFTFTDHPLRTLDPSRAPALITPSRIKEQILRGMGLDLLILIPFSSQLAEMEPRSFVEQILIGILRVREMWLGFDFAFGRGRKGSCALLQDLGREWSFSVQVLPPVVCGGEVVSSTLIRDLLGKGRVAEASFLLGRPYLIQGQVVKGLGRGRNLGFPTANLKPPRDFLLPDGVYAGFARADGKMHQVAIHVGRAPTFAGKDRRIEVHFLHFGGNLYRRRLEIQFLERVREERKFSNQEELAQRIRQDTRHVAQLLTRIEREGGTNGFTRLSFCANRWQERR